MTADPRGRLADLRIERDDDEARRPWLRWVVLLAAALVLVALAGWWFLVRDTAPEVRTAVVTPAETGRAGVSVLDASGYVTARRRATVSSKITGKVTDVLIEEGMAVREGQVLARLDDSLVQRQLALAEAQLVAARNRLREAVVWRDDAELELGRQRRLVAADVSSQRDLDAAQAEYDALVARVESAQAEITLAESEIALRRQELEDHRIRAPFDGIAISKNVQPGEMISPVSAGGGFTRTGVSTVVDMSSLEIEVDVNEAYINRVAPDQRVVATLDAYPDWQIPAHVITTIPAADRQKATVRVRIAFDEIGDPRILPDMGVKVSFREGTGAPPQDEAPHRVLLVPDAAVRREGNAEIVFVVAGEKVERRAVALGGEVEGRREVRSGLREGERVVLDPPAGLADGAAIRSAE